MYFQESEAIALEHQDLRKVIEEVDQQLSGIKSSAPLRPTDFACALGADENQVMSVFELLAQQGILAPEEMLECQRCHNLMPAIAFSQAIDDEDEFSCSSCSRLFSRFSDAILIYRLTTAALCRIDALVPAALDSAFDQPTEVKNTPANSFQRNSDLWILSFAGRAVTLKDSVGLVYIARLLSEPNRDIAAVSLLAARAGIDPRIAKGSLGPALDEPARKNLQKHYTELQEELDEAGKNNDRGRIEFLKREMDQLMVELANATGLGNRRRQTSSADKVRKAVSMAVSRGIQRIKENHQSLGLHLRASITSGYTFRYAPEHPVDWLI